MGLPFEGNHGGQILFNPEDGYLYFMMGDGGGKDDPFNFSQNKKSLLGKIMRLDVDNMPSKYSICLLTVFLCHFSNPFCNIMLIRQRRNSRSQSMGKLFCT